MDQPKIERMLRLMQMMSGNINYTVDELADQLGMSYRTIYRYIDSFKSAGFTVSKLHSNVYKIEKMPGNMPSFDKLLYFSEEESYLINTLIESLVPTNALKKSIKKKLAVVYDSTAIADFVDRRSNAAHVESLRTAASLKQKVVLKDYESGHSNTVRNRFIEPYGFTTDYIDVCAYDLEDGRNKIFKIQRIGEVIVTEDKWTQEAEHSRQGMDIFRMSGQPVGRIILSMSVMAKNLLIEEYPLAEKHLSRKGDRWILDTEVNSYISACRFFLGLSKEIRIIDSDDFLEFVRREVKEHLADL